MKKIDEDIMHKVIDDIIDSYDKEKMKELVQDLREGGKPFYLSKTLWINIIALGAIVAQSYYGYVVSPEIQGILLVLVNIALRKITKEELK